MKGVFNEEIHKLLFSSYYGFFNHSKMEFSHTTKTTPTQHPSPMSVHIKFGGRIVRKKLIVTFYACACIAVIIYLVSFLLFTEGNNDGALTAARISLVFIVLSILAGQLHRFF